jgi:hypothetical protein
MQLIRRDVVCPIDVAGVADVATMSESQAPGERPALQYRQPQMLE